MQQWRTVALYMKGQLKCVELIYGMDDRLGECLWVGTVRQTNKGGIVMGGYCRPHGEEVDEIFCKLLKKVSRPQTLVLIGDLNLSEARGGKVSRKQISGGWQGQLLNTNARWATKDDTLLVAVVLKDVVVSLNEMN